MVKSQFLWARSVYAENFQCLTICYANLSYFVPDQVLVSFYWNVLIGLLNLPNACRIENEFLGFNFIFNKVDFNIFMS